MRLRAEQGGTAGEEVVILAGKQPLVRQIPPAAKDKPVKPQLVMERLPRITKLLALAVQSSFAST